MRSGLVNIIILATIAWHVKATSEMENLMTYKTVSGHSQFIAHDLGFLHNQQYGKLYLPINLLEIFQLGSMANHSLNLFMEIHAADDSNFRDFPVYPKSVQEALSHIQTKSELTNASSPVYPVDSSKADHVKTYGDAATQKSYVLREITLLRNELSSVTDQIWHIFEKWSYLQVRDEEGMQDPREFLNIMTKTLENLNLATFLAENGQNKTLGADEILNHLRDPKFTYPNVTEEQRKKLKNYEQLPLSSNQKLSLGLQSNGNLSYKDFSGLTEAPERIKRQAIIGILLAGVLGFAGGSYLSGSLGSLFPGSVSHADLAAVLDDVRANQEQIHILCQDFSNISHVTKDIMERQRDFYTHLTQLDGKIYRNTRRVDFLESMALLRPLLNAYSRTTNQMVNAINSVEVNQFPGQFVKLAHLTEPLKELYDKVQPQGYREITNDARILLTANLRIMVIDFQILIEFSVPLEKTSVQMAKLVHIPSNQKLLINELTYSLHLPTNLFQVQKQSKSMNVLKNFPLSSCKIFQKQHKLHQNVSSLQANSEIDQVYLCPQTTKIRDDTHNIFHHNTRLTGCIFSLVGGDTDGILKYCNITVSPLLKEIAMKLPQNNFVVNSIHNYRKILYCSQTDYFSNKMILQEKEYFDKHLVLKIPENCFLKTHNYILIPDLSPKVVTAKPIISKFDNQGMFDFINQHARYRFRSSLHFKEVLRDFSIRSNMSQVEKDIRNLDEIVDSLPKQLTFADIANHPLIETIRNTIVSILIFLASVYFMYYLAKNLPRMARVTREKMWHSSVGRKMSKWAYKSEAVPDVESEPTKDESQPKEVEPTDAAPEKEEKNPDGGVVTRQEHLKLANQTDNLTKIAVTQNSVQKDIQTKINKMSTS